MQMFQLIQKRFGIIGISSWQSAQKYSLSAKVVIDFLIFGFCLFAHFMYIFLLANGYAELVECITSTSASIIAFVCFATIAIKSSILFEIIEKAEKFIGNS